MVVCCGVLILYRTTTKRGEHTLSVMRQARGRRDPFLRARATVARPRAAARQRVSTCHSQPSRNEAVELELELELAIIHWRKRERNMAPRLSAAMSRKFGTLRARPGLCAIGMVSC